MSIEEGAGKRAAVQSKEAKLEAIQGTLQRVVVFQNAMYKWTLQNHANIKQIIKTINEVAVTVSEATGKLIEPIEVVEDPSLLNGDVRKTPVPNKANVMDVEYYEPRAETFHDVVMKNRDNVHSEEFRHLLRTSMNQSQFDELKEDSLALLLPGVIDDISNKEHFAFGIAFVAASFEVFPEILRREDCSRLPLKIMEALRNLRDPRLMEQPDTKRQADLIKKVALEALSM